MPPLFKLFIMCDTPHYVDNPTYPWDASGNKQIPVPCGRCPRCKKNRTHQWIFRLLQEDKVSSSAYFITLTYDTDHVPISPNGFMTLDKKEYPRFMKRLRKLHPKGVKLKYYAVGEYGTTNNRPHYHAILFNADKVLIEKAWSLDSVPLGGIHIGDVNGKSVGYTAKYINKPTRIPMFTNDDRVKEFSLMSKGLGASYMSTSVVQYHKADLSRNYVTLQDGIKVPLPRYYRNKIYSDKELLDQKNIIVRAIRGDEQVSKEDYLRDNPDGDYDLFKEQQRIARYNKFYHFTNHENRKL